MNTNLSLMQASTPDPGWWQRWIARAFGPPLPPHLQKEFTVALGAYFRPFLLASPVAAALTVAASLSVQSNTAVFFSGMCLVGLGFILRACHQALHLADERMIPDIENRFSTGGLIFAAGLGGLVLSVLAGGASMVAQGVVVMVALATMGIGHGTGTGRPGAAVIQGISLSLPVAVSILVIWQWPWGLAGGLGVLAYGAVCLGMVKRNHMLQCELLVTRDLQRAERERMDVAMETMDQPIAVLDDDLRLVSINRSALDLVGIAAVNKARPPLLTELMGDAINVSGTYAKPEELLGPAAMLLAARQRFTTVVRLKDGRFVDMEGLPLPGGGWLALLHDSTTERNAIDELNREIRRCPLTGLPNRRAFDEELERRLGAGETFALILLDLDGFKQVNDRHGHGVGDRVITRIGFRLRTADPALFAARLGGDEFAMLASIDHTDEAMALARRLVDSIDAPMRMGEDEIQLGAAAGVVLSTAAGDDAKQLMRAADLALIAAKGDPSNQVQLFSAELQEEAAGTAVLETRVRAALRAGRLDVAYQPVVDLGLGRVVGVEALTRWRDDGGASVSPDRVVAIAEARGLTDRLRRAVLDQAAPLIANWPVPLDLWVNASVQDLVQPGVVGEVMAAISAAGIAPDRLTLEITETALMTDEGGCIEHLAQLRGHGVRLAMDDFGAGFSSLERLRRLPISALKISGSLLTGAPGNPVASDIFRVAATLGSSMGLMLVAEGVEGPAELSLVREAGVGFAQGFGLAQPVPAHQLAAAIERAEDAVRATRGIPVRTLNPNPPARRRIRQR